MQKCDVLAPELSGEALARFYAKVLKTPGCWLWQAWRTSEGYGRIKYKGKGYPAHRLIYAHTHGPIPANLVVMHICDVRNCVRLEHLKLGTNVENIKDRHDKGRTRVVSGEDHPHVKITTAQVLAMRVDYSNGATYAEIEKIHGVNRKTVRNVVNRLSWRFV